MNTTPDQFLSAWGSLNRAIKKVETASIANLKERVNDLQIEHAQFDNLAMVLAAEMFKREDTW